MFRVGQKVVCVDAVNNLLLKEGAIYTVRDCGWHWGRHAPLGVWLIEAEHKALRGTPFYASRFRPVVERKTNISIFTAMLNPKKQKVRV